MIKLDKKIIGLLLSIIIVIIVITSSTYSLLSKEDVTEEQSYTTGILEITSTAVNDSVTLSNALPMEDSAGLALTPYTFKIENVGNLDYTFDIKLLSTVAENLINPDYIKLSIDGVNVLTLSELTDSIIKENVTLIVGSNIKLNLRVWLDYYTPNSEIGKVFNAKIATDGYAVYLADDLEINNITVIGSSFVGFPVGSYTAEVTCDGAVATFDYENWALKISNVSNESRSICQTNFTGGTPNYLNNHIKSLVETEQGTGKVVIENGYRYQGEDPNNYIRFNNELWRIIGVFDETSHGQTGEYLTKIIRNDSIGGYPWDINNSNDWTTASLNKLLNGPYYDYDAEGNDAIISENCYKNVYDTEYISGNCDYSVIGIQDEYRSMVKNVTWFLGGGDGNAQTFYTNERSGSTTTGYIGLMYPSDYGYSVIASDSCSRNTGLESYNTEACGGNSWFLKTTYDWTITPHPSNLNYVFSLYYSGILSSLYAYYGFATPRPVLYLNSNVYITSGTGTSSDPYTINM